MGNAESAFDSEAYIQGLEGSQVGSENSAAGATASGKSRSKLADEARDCTQLQVLADGDEVYRRGENYLRYQVAFAEALVEFDRAKGPSDVLACLSQLRETMASFRDLPLLPESLAVTAVSKLASCLSASFPQEVHLETWKTFASIFDKIGPARFARDLPNYSMVVFAAFGLNLSAEVVHELLHLVNSYYLKLPGSHLQPCVGGLMNALLSLKVSGTSNGEASGDAPAVYEKDGSRTSQAGQIQGEARALLVNMRERTDSAKFDILLCQSIVANEGVRTRALSLLLHVVQNMLEEKCTLAFAGTLTSMLAACLMEGCISVQVMCLQIIQEYDSVIPQDYIEEGKHILATSILVTIPSAVTEVSEPALSWLKENCCEAGASGESIVSEAMLEIVESAISRYVFPSSPAPNSHVVSSRAHQGNEWNHVIHIFDVLGSAFQYFPEHFARVARPRHVYELLAASLEIVGDHGDGQVDEALADVARTTCQVFAVQTIWEDLRQFFQSVGLGRGLPVMKVVACPDRWETSSVRVILKATGGTFERMISDLLQHANDLMNLKARTKATWNQLYGLLHYCSGFFFALVEDGVLTKCRTLSHQFRDTFWRFLDMECVQDPEEEQYSLLLGPFQDSPVAELLGVSCRVVLHIEAAWSRSDCSSPGRDPVAFLTNYATGGSVNNSKLTAALVCVKMFGVPMPLGERHVERTREIAMWLWALIHAEDDKLVDSQYSSDAAALFSELLHCAYPICHDVIVQSMQLSSGHRKVVGYLRVSILWNFCRREQPSTLRYLSSRAVGGTVSTPSVLFLMLDAVDSSDARLRFVSQKWLQDALVSPAPVLEALLQPLLGPTMTKLKDEMEYVVAYDTRYVLYVLDRLRTIVRFGSQGLIRAAGAESVPPATVQATLRVCTRAETRKGLRWDKMGIPEEKVSSLLEVLAAALAGLACGRVNAENEDKFEQDNIEVGCQSLELLQELLKLAVPPPCAWRLADLLAPLCVRLLSTRRDHLPYQHAVLGLLSTVLAALTFGGGRVASSSNGSSADGAAKDRAGSGLAIFESNEFLHVLEEGMVSAAAAHSHILVDWVDFCVRCLSCIWLMSPTAAPRLISVMCNVVQERTSNLRSLLLHQEECLVLLGGLAQITQQCVLGSMPTLSSKPITVSPKNSEAGSMKGRDKPDRRGSQVTSMLSDFVKNVFAGNTSGRTVDNSHDPRNLALQMLPQLLDATFSIWEALTHLPNSLNEHARQVVESIKKAVARLLSPLAAAAPLEYFDSVTTLWALHNRAHGTSAADVVLRMVHATEGATLKRLFSAARKLTTTICNSAQDDLDVHSKGNRVSEIVGFLYSFLLSEAQETHAGLHIAWEQFKTVLALLIGTDISSRIDSATDPDTIAVNSAAGYSAGGASPTMVLLKGKGPLWALRLLQAYVKAAGTLKRSDCAQEQQIVNEVLFACFFTATSTPRETPTHGAVGVSDEGDIGGLILSQTVAALPSLLDWAYEQLKGDSDRVRTKLITVSILQCTEIKRTVDATGTRAEIQAGSIRPLGELCLRDDATGDCSPSAAAHPEVSK
eukprot:scaffold1504_cov417-Prasinococcus_capsulatus_cf.AAC.50